MEPPIPPETRQAIVDAEHLRLLALFHYICGGLTIAFSALFIFHTVALSVLAAHPEWLPAQEVRGLGEMPFNLMRMMAVVTGSFVALGIGFGIAQIVSGRFIGRRRHRIFSIVVAVLSLFLIPYGTLLGIFTLIVLSRDGVRDLYQGESPVPV
jgi:ABC-type phosphate transport system permease subunit